MTSTTRLFLFCTLLLLPALGATSFASTAHAQRNARRISVEGYFIGEFLGEYRLRVEGERRASGDIDLDTTYGAGGRITMHAGYFALGAMAEFRGYGTGDYNERDFAFDFSPFVGARIPIYEERDTAVRLRATFPLGFTVLQPNEDRYGDASYLGFNLGALGGVEMTFGQFGLFTDVGVRYHRVYADEDLGPLGNVSASLSWAQLSVNAGAQFAF